MYKLSAIQFNISNILLKQVYFFGQLFYMSNIFNVEKLTKPFIGNKSKYSEFNLN